MTKHAPEIISAEDLAARIFDRETLDGHDFSAVVDDDCNLQPEAAGKHFVLQWPDHCVTKQHLGDASIIGPFDSSVEAEEYVA